MANQPAASNCTIEQQRIGEIEVLFVAGVVDMLTAPQLEEAIATAGKDSPRGVIVDLGAVDFLASAGMGILVSARDELPALCAIRRCRRRACDKPATQVGWYRRHRRTARDAGRSNCRADGITKSRSG